jgi:hypothetical protein
LIYRGKRKRYVINNSMKKKTERKIKAKKEGLTPKRMGKKCKARKRSLT